jgi:hypothetical protein
VGEGHRWEVDPNFHGVDEESINLNCHGTPQATWWRSPLVNSMMNFHPSSALIWSDSIRCVPTLSTPSSGPSACQISQQRLRGRGWRQQSEVVYLFGLSSMTNVCSFFDALAVRISLSFWMWEGWVVFQGLLHCCLPPGRTSRELASQLQCRPLQQGSPPLTTWRKWSSSSCVRVMPNTIGITYKNCTASQSLHPPLTVISKYPFHNTLSTPILRA